MHLHKMLVILLLLVSLNIECLGNVVFENGKTEYTIVISKNASVSEITSSKELAKILFKISKANFNISNNLNQQGKCIIVGYNERVHRDINCSKPIDTDESFTYITKKENIYIYGGRERGTMYGVYSFLENELGVRWLTKDCTVIPQKKKWIINNIKRHESPAFRYRFDEFYHFCNDTALYAHNKMNMQWEALPTKYGRIEPYWCVHTSFYLIPPEKYFKQHPEYFSLRNGKRIDNGQLCLSNPYVLKEIIERLREKGFNDVIKYWGYDVSQNDNQLFCECEKCKNIEKKYGGHSGIWIWFVNQVAKANPQYTIGTLAYQYTQTPPQNIKPLSNVVVRLCPINNCYSHSIYTCDKNKGFRKDLKGWAAISQNLYIYDYVVDFNQFLLPWPNFQVLSPNLKLFKESHAIAVHESGQYKSGDGEFSEMKAWVISKLLWNPYQDTDSLVKVFTNGYYGKSASTVYDYYELCKTMVNEKTHLTTMTRWDDLIYTDSFIQQAKELVAKAENLSNDSIIRKRIDKVALQVYYLETMRNKIAALKSGSHRKAVQLIERDKPYINERISADDFIKKIKYI